MCLSFFCSVELHIVVFFKKHYFFSICHAVHMLLSFLRFLTIAHCKNPFPKNKKSSESFSYLLSKIFEFSHLFSFYVVHSLIFSHFFSQFYHCIFHFAHLKTFNKPLPFLSSQLFYHCISFLSFYYSPYI